MRRNAQYIFPPPILKKRRKSGQYRQSDFINLHENIPLNTGLVQTYQSPVESARMPALYTYIKLYGRFQSTAPKLKIVRTVEICAHMCGHVRTSYMCAQFEICAHIFQSSKNINTASEALTNGPRTFSTPCSYR
jgi:hypothetical protein